MKDQEKWLLETLLGEDCWRSGGDTDGNIQVLPEKKKAWSDPTWAHAAALTSNPPVLQFPEAQPGEFTWS